ncbi:ODV_E66 [Dikerogammarus haemobaphes nudivirus]|nr:ODV_E66 [Dikerogammarus haemobaphes nudivirus]
MQQPPPSLSKFFTLDYGVDSKREENTKLMSIFVIILLILVIGFMLIDFKQPYTKVIKFIYKSTYFTPLDFTDYDFETQGRVKYNWHVDEKGLGAICHFWNSGCGWMDKTDTKESRKAVKAFEDWIFAFLSELEKTEIVNSGFQGFPWGNNWYEFSIESTRTMAYYIVMNKHNGTTSIFAANSILYIIVNPQMSLGYERDKANSAMMVFPWSLAHSILGTLTEAKQDPSFAYAIAQYDLTPNETLQCNADGVHIDYSYLTHNGVYAFGYVDSIMEFYPDTKQVLPEIPQTIDKIVDRMHAYLRHPTIPLSGATLWNRQENTKSATYNGNLKTKACMVIPSMRYIRFFGTTPGNEYQWCAKPGQQTVAYYECDQSVQNMGLYSCFCRKAFRPNDSSDVNAFTDGFILKKTSDDLLTVPAVETTTTTYRCEPWNDGSVTYVFTDGEEWGFCRQQWIWYPPMLSRGFHMDESIYIDIKNEIITVNYGFGNGISELPEDQLTRRDYDLICNGERHDMGVPWHNIIIDLKNKTTTWEESDSYNHALNKKTPYIEFSRSLPNGGSYTIIYRDDQPKFLCPAENWVMGYTQEVPSKDESEILKFDFDEDMNQYLYTSTRKIQQMDYLDKKLKYRFTVDSFAQYLCTYQLVHIPIIGGEALEQAKLAYIKTGTPAALEFKKEQKM